MKKSLKGTRRTFLKGTAAAIAAPLVLTPRKGAAQAVPPLPPSPPTTPFVEFLPNAITPLQALSESMGATMAANFAGGECGRADHQRFLEFCPPDVLPTLYELSAKENPLWSFNPAYPPQPVWGFEGRLPGGGTTGVTTPGPTIFARYGETIIARIRNELPQDHVGFGSPETAIHLHNMHTPSESDGFPGDFFSPVTAGPTLTAPGLFVDHQYPNVYAGVDTFGGIGDPNEALGTLFYHDHAEGVTAPNVQKGLLGMYLIFDHLDTGSETTGLRLPSHPYDYPLVFSDKRFDANKILFFDQINPEGTLGDKTTVNGKIEPVLRVARRKYRLRLLNGGPARFYEFYLQNKSANTVYTFTHIANDGNLLPAPIKNVFKVRLGVAERADIVVDFSRFPLNTELYLVNQLVQNDTRGPQTAVVAPGTRILKFIVDRNAADPSVVPNVLRPLPALPDAATLAALPVRRWEFGRNSGMWNINDQFFDVFTPQAAIPKGSAEVWEFVNLDNGWSHPIHMHFEEGRILSRSRNGVNIPVPVHERGRKDVIILGPLETVRVFYRFRDFLGKYVLHCHNLTHEDHAMMARVDIVPA